MPSNPETQLQEQRFLQDVLNYIPSDIAVFDSGHRYLFLNAVAVADPVTRRWLIGKTEADYFTLGGKDGQICRLRGEFFQELLHTKKPASWEEEYTCNRGAKAIHLRNLFPILDEVGDVKMVIAYSIDITERKKIEDHIHRSEKRYRDLFNYCQALICTHDLSGKILTVNPAIRQLLQYDEEELIGRNIKSLLPMEQQSLFERNYLEIILRNGRSQGVFSVINKSGKKKYLLYQNYKLEEEGSEPYIIGFSQDITQRILTERELLQNKKVTEDAYRAKETFLANMSHEIRTPMNGILGIAGLMAKTKLDEQQQTYLKLIQDSAASLLVIVNDILDLEKIEAGKMQLEEIPFNVSEKIVNTIHSFTFTAEEKGIRLNYVNRLPDNLHVSGDPYRLGQVLNNFLGNAVKFTEKGHVTLTTNMKFDKEDWVAIEFLVQDSGIGIDREKINAIFSPFVQANTDTTRKYGGTGLGLSICKNLIEIQGGELWVESEAGSGASFRFILPYRKCETPAMVQPPPLDSGFGGLGPRRALVAEDVELNQFLARHIMESWGFEVVIVENGLKAVEALEKEAFDFVLMDIQMPEMDGMEATTHIRAMKDPVKAQIPIIALTANVLKGDSEKYLLAGMNDYLSKPFSEEQLFNVIRDNLAGCGRQPRENKAVGAQGEQSTETDGRLYDLSMIQSVSGSDENFTRRMVALFIETVPPGVADLKNACTLQHWEQVGKIAHKLKSTIDSMGISCLREDVRSIEFRARQGRDTAIIPAAITRLERIIGDCVIQLRADFNL